MAKKKPQKRGIVTSHQRGKEAIAEARINPVKKEENPRKDIFYTWKPEP